MRTNELMLYKHMEEGQILNDMTFLMENYANDYYNMEDMKGLLFDLVNEILELAVSHGFEGNLWHNYLTYLLASHENAYSTSCEIVGPVEGSINEVALHDFAIFKELFDYDFQALEETMGVDCLSMIRDYAGTSGHGKIFNQRIRDRICDLSRSLAKAETPEEFKAILTQFYKEFGVGKFGLHKAFRIEHMEEGTEIVPITKIAHVHLDDLSFEEFEIEYKYLKAVIEGGLERKPENVLIYATSNRRHLIKETFKDKADRDEELHTNDTVQEKLSLVARFGVTIYFGKPDKKEFQEIVRKLAQKSGIDMPEDELLLEANKWELSHGGLSGRTAQQFVDYLAGMQ